MILHGHLLDTDADGRLRVVRDGWIEVGGDGRIAAAGTSAAGDGSPARRLIIPGLIDVHAHLPQYPAVARREEALLPWLERHVFPLEREFRREAQRPYLEAFFDEVAAHGITTIVLYGAVWEDSTDLAFEVAARKGIRAVIGKVMMDVASYGEATPVDARELSLEQTRRLLEKWHGAEDGRLEYAVSPRFAVTCSMELMREAAELAQEHDAYVQTHLSENQAEIEAVARLFPDADSYTDVYRQAGLLGPRTILGHCLHPSDEEWAMLGDSGSRVAHCPTSNFFLNSGLFPLDRADAHGVGVALASDVAGGPELNPWQVMRSAIEGQKARRFAGAEIEELIPARAFHLATRGAAAVLGKDDAIGGLDVGMEADLAVFDLDRIFPLAGGWSPDDLDDDQLLTACIYRGKPEACLASYVRGKEIHHA